MALLALLLLLVLAPPAAAAADREVRSLGEVRAVREDLRLRVERAGVVTFDRVLVEDCGPFCSADRLVLRDLDRDGVAEVVARVFTGGASCCVAGTIVTGTGAVLRRDFGRTGVRVADDGDLVTADRRLDGAFASTAGSATPVLVLRLRGGRLVDVTDAARARRDAERLWRAWRRVPRADRRFAAGVLAAWAADRYRLGARRSALRVLRRELPALAGRIDRRLRALGY